MVARFIGNTAGTNYKNEILSGLTVAIALVPEAIAFSFIAGVDPLVGLYAACIMGFVTSLLGGRPGMISGSTGAIAVVIASTVETYGEAYLYPTIILGGMIQMVIGSLRFGKFIRLVPHSVMLGFVNGLAIVIFMAQFPMFGETKTVSLEPTEVKTITVQSAKIDNQQVILADSDMADSQVLPAEKEQTKTYVDYYGGSKLYSMIGLVILTMGIMFFLPKLTKAVPSGLVAILVVGGISLIPGFDTPTVHTLLQGKSMEGGLPSIFTDYPADLLSWNTLNIIILPALSVAGVGLIESLLTLTLIDEKTNSRGSGNQESMAQGLANIISGLFGSMGGCAMIGQSMINIDSGARKRLSGLVASVALLCFIMYLSPVIEQIPVAALIGVMFMVSYGTFEWSSLKELKKNPLSDTIIMIIVAGYTVVFHNLAVAVVIGVVLAAISVAWDNAARIRARKRIDENGIKNYDIYGPLFFASTTAFMSKFKVEDDPEAVIIDFEDSRVVDQSGIEAIKKIDEKYKAAGKKVSFVNLSQDCQELLGTADVRVTMDPDKRKFSVVYDSKV